MKTIKNKYYIVALAVLGVFNFSHAQIKQNVESEVNVNSNAFLDASGNAKNAKANVGKGLLMPPTDLSTFMLDKSALDDINYPTYFDGMIVYNTKDGGSTTDPNIQQTDNLKVGYYYFSNPNGIKRKSINQGQWKPLTAEAGTGGVSIYNANGVLDENRVVDIGANSLSFVGAGKVGINQTPDASVKADLQVKGLIRSNNIRKKGNELTGKSTGRAKEVFVDENGVFRVKEADEDPTFGPPPTCRFVVDETSKLFWADNFGLTAEDIKPAASQSMIDRMVEFISTREDESKYLPIIDYFKRRKSEGCRSRFGDNVEKIERIIYCKQKDNPMIFKFNVRDFRNYGGDNYSITINNEGYNTYKGGRTPLFNMNISDLLNNSYDDGGPIPICPPLDDLKPSVCTLIEKVPNIY